MRSRWTRLLLLPVLLAGASRLAAQIDPKWQTPTDILDVFKIRGGKSEVLCLLDFSGSMRRTMWHGSFYTGKSYRTNFTTQSNANPYNETNLDDDVVTFRFKLAYNSGSGKYVFSITSNYEDGGTLFYDCQSKDSSGNVTNGLVDIQGRLITHDLLTGTYGLTTTQVTYPANWIKYATHMRLRMDGNSYAATKYAAYTTKVPGTPTPVRIVDVPLPWKLFTSPSSVPATADNYSEEYTFDLKNDPSKTTRIWYDTAPYPSNTPDATGSNADPTVGVSSNSQASTGTSRSGTLTVGDASVPMEINTDYLYWIFFGTGGVPSQRVVSPTTGIPSMSTSGLSHYVIPSVYETGPYAAGAPTATAWGNGLPVTTRYQALKAALIGVYFGKTASDSFVQDAAYWAFRYLDPNESTVSYNNDITGTARRSLRLLQPYVSGAPTAGLKDLQGRTPTDGTPMTWGIANCLLQFNATALGGNGKSIFDPANNNNQPAALCGKNFLLLATDGNPSETPQPTAATYYGGTNAASPTTVKDGNAQIQANKTQMDPTSGNKFWNPETLMGIAAHGTDGAPNSTTNYITAGDSTTVMAKYAPFQITARGSSSGLSPRPITGFAIGISQGGNLSETGSPQRRLNSFALWGNPYQPTGAAEFAKDSSGNPAASPNFVNAQNPRALRDAIANLAAQTLLASASYTAPSVPYIGTRLGNTTYMGLFRTVLAGPRWYGDLLMAGLQDTANGALFVDRDGTQTNVLKKSNAVWAASDVLHAYGSADKRQGKVYTYLPGGNALSVVAPEETSFLQSLQSAITSASPSQANLKLFLWSMLGGDTSKPMLTATAGSYPMRLDDQGQPGGAMGDIINGNPAVLEYDNTLATDTVLKAFVQSYDSDNTAGKSTTGAKFRVIYVSTNHGHIHAFGEVSYTYTDTTGVIRPKAAVIELWSFIPTEAILTPWYLDNVDASNNPMSVPNPHVYMADGSPFIYFDDKPTRSDLSVGDGVVNGDDTAFLIVGMGKGGRSYYCLDVKNPYTPVFKWALRPDEVGSGGNAVVRSMGLSTCLPAIARAVQGNTVKDFVVLGGGFSNGDIEGNVGWNSTNAATVPPKFGRSVVAFDVYTGPGTSASSSNTLTWTHTDMGSVSAGTMPFEFYAGSYMTQRIYFTDRKGRIWALGNTATNGSGTRAGMDTSDVSKWSVRKVMSPASDTVISTLPEVFRLNNGVIPGTSVAGVGIVYGTGDRNNPMDYPAGSAGVIPGAIGGKNVNRLGLVFDTNDPAVDSTGRTESSLADLTAAATLADANPSTYLVVDSATRKPTKFGWYLTFNKSGNFYDKVINQSLVINNVLFFSLFTPQPNGNDPCGGAGITNTFRECDVTTPLYGNGTKTTVWTFANGDCLTSSGKVINVSFTNLASDVSPLGNTQTLQAGQDATSTSGGTVGTAIHQIMGKGIPIGLRMRAWRIVR